MGQFDVGLRESAGAHNYQHYLEREEEEENEEEEGDENGGDRIGGDDEYGKGENCTSCTFLCVLQILVCYLLHILEESFFYDYLQNATISTTF